jgi:glycine/D-amino acid oxidase-like deaminating enzyme/nitrite reductase/ring-hydroxylating ferredoxin subunit
MFALSAGNILKSPCVQLAQIFLSFPGTKTALIMFTKSIWNAFAKIHDFPTLDKDLQVDVAIIGAGITGLATAIELKEKGFKVAVLEALKVGGGSTGHSTGNLYHTIDKNLEEIESKYNEDTLKDLIAARAAGLDKAKAYISKYNLDCDKVECCWYMYAGNEKMNEEIETMLKYGRHASAGIEEAPVSEIPFKATKAVKVDKQLQLNPMRFVQELARAVQSDQLQIFECTRVREVKKEGGNHVLTTTGGTVRAKNVVYATHTPKGVKFIQTLLGPYREYGIACKIKDDFPKGIFWGYFKKNEKISARHYTRDGQKFLIVVGQPHKVGQENDTASRIRELEAFARRHYQIEEVTYRWGGQHYRPADLLPYIGREPGEETSFIATGYSTDGIIYGVVAGMIISDLIAGVKNPWLEVFDSTRSQPLKAAANFLKENLNVATQFRKNLPGKADAGDYSEIKNGEGAVIDNKGKKIAAHRDESGKLHLCSAVCTHMACIVNWNNAEKSWDCPCHGSRFKPDGTVMEGPAYEPLTPLE